MKGIVVKILVAGIAIQSSRFLTAATIDISTIATAAVGAMPSQIIGSNGDIYLKFKQSTFFKELETSNEMITSKREITLFPEPDKASDEYIYVRKKTIATTGIPEKNLIDSLLPNQNHLAGPLIFIGMGILELNQDITIDINHPIASLLKLIFSGIEIVVYSIAMIFLCIVAFMRVIYLWLFIILSPLLALLSCLKYIGKTEQIDTSKMTDKIMK